MPLKVLILGANGFIGSSLTRAILKQKDWEVYGMDIGSHKLDDSLGNPRFKFVEGDITINREYIEYHVKKCDAIIPLVAIANPIQYVKDPLRVFELDFEANLAIVRQCAKYKKRIIFPSTSEVYGMSTDPKLDEATSALVYGPIERQRWIYACSKQLLDRVIYAYGVRDGVDYTLFRPFNWIGPKLDDVFEPKEGSSRLFTQFISWTTFSRPFPVRFRTPPLLLSSIARAECAEAWRRVRFASSATRTFRTSLVVLMPGRRPACRSCSNR